MSKTFKSEGIIFRSLKYSETSIILDIYTYEVGLQSFIVSGVRKSKSKFSNNFQPMNIINVVAYNSDGKLSRIKESELSFRYDKVNLNVVLSSVGMFIIDLARNAIKEKEPNHDLYYFIRHQLIALDQKPSGLQNTPVNFALMLASYLGFEITDNYSEDNKYFDLHSGQFIGNNLSNSLIMNDLLSYKLHLLLSNNTDLEIDKLSRNLILDNVLKFYAFHIEGFKPLKSLPVLRTILS